MSMVSLPRLCSFAFTAGSASALRTSALILFTSAGFIPAGPHMATQRADSASLTPASAIVGTSGSVALRFPVVTASGRSFPALTLESTAEIGAQ